ARLKVFSIFSGMTVLAFLTMPSRINDNNHENQESQPQENQNPWSIFPDLLNPIRKLGPIHAFGRYTATGEKETSILGVGGSVRIAPVSFGLNGAVIIHWLHDSAGSVNVMRAKKSGSTRSRSDCHS